MGIKSSFFEWTFNFFLKKNGKNLRIVGSDSLKHPLGDLDFVEDKEDEVVLAINEMSLKGADSPLPYNFDFDSDILQHNLAMLRFNALLEKSPFLLQKLGNTKWQNRFASYNERFSQEYLRRFFTKMFPEAQISVYCFEPIRIKNPKPTILGKTNFGLLGEFCTSITEAMRVEVKNILRQKIIINEKFPFKIRIKFSAKKEIMSNKLSENFKLGNLFEWEMWI